MEHLLFENVTDMDKAKHTIAWTIADATRHNRDIDPDAVACYNALPVCDRLDVNRRVAVMTRVYNSSKTYSLLYCIKFLLPFIFLTIICLLLLFCCTACTMVQPRVQPRDTSQYIGYQLAMDKTIRSVLSSAQKHFTEDYNHDNEITCIDRAIAFKMVWDIKFNNNSKYKCELVRNYNPDVMNHLFVRVKHDSYNWIYVEPSAIEGVPYNMHVHWGARYNSTYNYYGETAYWMGTICE